MKLNKDSHRGADRSFTPLTDADSANSNGRLVNGTLMDSDGMETNEFDDDPASQSRKRKEPDSKVNKNLEKQIRRNDSALD